MSQAVQVRPPAILQTSSKGIQFLFELEQQVGVSEHLHCPGGASGVTIGAGYDFLHRTAPAISFDLIRAGVANMAASKVAAGAGLSGSAARDFAVKHRLDVTLTQGQQILLLQQIIGQYEAIVKRNVHVPITQNAFDALVSLCYNPGTSVVPITTLINNGKLNEAAQLWLHRVQSGGQTMGGLVRRRQREVNLFLHGTY